jgi:hypothetical protein
LSFLPCTSRRPKPERSEWFRAPPVQGLWAASKQSEAAAVAQSVEHILGKDEVIGSIPICSSMIIEN